MRFVDKYFLICLATPKFFICWTANNVDSFFRSSNLNSSKLSFPGTEKKIILNLIFSIFIFSSRQHVSNWSMTKENQDPSIKSLNSPSGKSTSRLMQQKSFEKTHQSPQHDSPQAAKLKSSSDLFELLERCQSQRLDDQRCVLPSYFSQVS